VRVCVRAGAGAGASGRAGGCAYARANTCACGGVFFFFSNLHHRSCPTSLNVPHHNRQDWSTQLWPHFDPVVRTVSARVRVHRVLPGPDQGPALVFEAAPMSPGDTVDSPADWSMVRCASCASWLVVLSGDVVAENDGVVLLASFSHHLICFSPRPLAGLSCTRFELRRCGRATSRGKWGA
jgi:hypothetical protein